MLVIYIKWYSFNPRTHAGCDLADAKAYLPKVVSIHAPTRGATAESDKDFLATGVSIHAPTRGATRSATR